MYIKLNQIKVELDDCGRATVRFTKIQPHQSKDDTVMIQNEELSGYRILEDGWIEDPRGFKTKASQQVISAIMSNSIISDGVILTPLTFVNKNSSAQLVSIYDQHYIDAVSNYDDVSKPVSSFEFGDIVVDRFGKRLVIGHTGNLYNSSSSYRPPAFKNKLGFLCFNDHYRKSTEVYEIKETPNGYRVVNYSTPTTKRQLAPTGEKIGDIEEFKRVVNQNIKTYAQLIFNNRWRHQLPGSLYGCFIPDSWKVEEILKEENNLDNIQHDRESFGYALLQKSPNASQRWVYERNGQTYVPIEVTQKFSRGLIFSSLDRNKSIWPAWDFYGILSVKHKVHLPCGSSFFINF